MTQVRPHDPFSAHVAPVPFQAPAPESSEAQRRDAALKAMAIEQHAVPVQKTLPKPRSAAKRKRARPTAEQVRAAVANLEPPK